MARITYIRSYATGYGARLSAVKDVHRKPVKNKYRRYTPLTAGGVQHTALSAHIFPFAFDDEAVRAPVLPSALHFMILARLT